MISLNVFCQSNTTISTMTRDDWSPVYAITGDQGNIWHNIHVTINKPSGVTGEHVLVFLVTRGQGYLGDVAIDDVVVSNKGCYTKS